MLKGVNKQIIEVNDIENEHFYKAILFVRPESSPRSNEFLNKQANEYILSASQDTKALPKGFLRRRAASRKKAVIIGIGVASSALLTAILLMLIL